VTQADPIGAYGLQLHETSGSRILSDQARSRLLPAEPSWPRWELRHCAPEGAVPDTEEWGPDRARLQAHPHGCFEFDRIKERTTFRVPEPIEPEALVHPYLASTAAIAGHWLGRSTFHAGAFAVDGRAWGVLGNREMGKSSLLMGLHMQGIPIITDDIVALEGQRAFSGPRCLDLRQSAAEQFGAGDPLGRLGRRERWRVRLPPVPGDWEFAGWILLGWSDTVVTEPLGAQERLSALAVNRAVVAAGATPPGLLDAVALPMVHFARPQDWSQLEPGLRRLLDSLADHA